MDKYTAIDIAGHRLEALLASQKSFAEFVNGQGGSFLPDFLSCVSAGASSLSEMSSDLAIPVDELLHTLVELRARVSEAACRDEMTGCRKPGWSMDSPNGAILTYLDLAFFLDSIPEVAFAIPDALLESEIERLGIGVDDAHVGNLIEQSKLLLDADGSAARADARQPDLPEAQSVPESMHADLHVARGNSRAVLDGVVGLIDSFRNWMGRSDDRLIPAMGLLRGTHSGHLEEDLVWQGEINLGDVLKDRRRFNKVIAVGAAWALFEGNRELKGYRMAVVLKKPGRAPIDRSPRVEVALVLGDERTAFSELTSSKVKLRLEASEGARSSWVDLPLSLSFRLQDPVPV